VKIQCHACRVLFSVPDEKIPEARDVRILCPKCRTPIQLPPRLQGLLSAEQEGVDDPLASNGHAPDQILEEGWALDVVEEGIKTCLLCVSNAARSLRIRHLLQELGYHVVPAYNTVFAMGKLRHNRYDLILLDEFFDDPESSDNLLLRHLQLLPMHSRRRFFLCLICDNLPTLDGMLAFRLGVNLILNVQDLDKIKVIMARAMTDHEILYALFNEELAGKGRR